MDTRTAKDVVMKYYPLTWRDGDGVVFHGSEGWIGDFRFGALYASDQKLWKQQLKPGEEKLYVSPEHNRNFIDCVKSRAQTICPVEMGIRCDTICHMVNAAAQTARVINWNPKTEKIIGGKQAANILTRTFRKKWKVW
jgi:hypothetical protein